MFIKYIPLYEHHTDKNNNKILQMSCTVYFGYTYHLLHDNFCQIKSKQVLCEICSFGPFLCVKTILDLIPALKTLLN